MVHRIKFMQGIGGLVVEYSPATRVTRVQFPVDAQFFFLFLYILQKSKQLKKNNITNIHIDSASGGILFKWVTETALK